MKIKEYKDEFEKKIIKYESELQNNQAKQNNLVDRYDILKEQTNKQHIENINLRIQVNNSSTGTEIVDNELKKSKMLDGNLKFLNESKR